MDVPRLAIGAGVVLLAVLALLALLWSVQRGMLYFPDDRTVPQASSLLVGGEDVAFATEDGLRLGGWFAPARGPAVAAVLVCNGNAGNRSDRASLAAALAREGFAVLLFDYRGYGGNPGRPTEEGLALDVRAARAFLLEQGVPPDRLLYLGESLGSAVVTELAAEHPPAGMLLRSPFPDLAAVGRVHYPFLPVRTLLRDRFPLVEHLAEVEVPVTVVYGDQDVLVPPAQSREVADAAPRLRRLVEVAGAGHNDPEMFDGVDLVDAVVDLADHISADR